MAPISTMTSSSIIPEVMSDLPIRQRGLFLNDHFFRDSREHFQQALDKVLQDWEVQDISNLQSSKLSNWDEHIFTDRLNRYRSLKKDNIKTDSQAVTETSNEHEHKIIIDVREFMHGNLNISIVGDHELLVRGSIEETSASVRGKRTFEKKFMLPSNTIINETTSAMSSDGILTIISPKKIIEKERKENKKEDLSKHQMDYNKQTALNQKHSLFADDFMNEFLPISRRGHFFNDSIFKDAHQDYNRAVQDVLDRWNETSNNEFSSYRNLRSQSLKDDNQAITERDNDQEYKIEINEYNEKNIPVKHENLMKKGSTESTLNSKENKLITKNENETHPLIAKECITNIRYISDSEIAEKMKKDSNIEIIIPFKQNVSENTNGIESSQNNMKQKKVEEGTLMEVQKSLNTINEESDKTSDTESELSETASENNNSSFQKISGREYMIPVDLEIDADDLKVNTNRSEEENVDEQKYEHAGVEKTNETNINIGHENTPLNKISIARRGPFFIDSFFNESQKNFEKAVHNVLQKSGFNSKKNDLTFYRSLRERSNSEQNQANDCTEDDKSFNIIIDLQGFKNDDITIKVHNDNELTVEGEQNQNQKDTLFKRKFCRKIVFPSHIICNEVTSAMSEDGVLTINAPKEIKECKAGTMSDEAITSFLISDDSNDELNNPNVKDSNTDHRSIHKTLGSHESDFIKCVDTCEHGVDEDSQTLPITRRGSFFTDPYFEDSRLVFKDAISNIIDKSGFNSKGDDFSFYKAMQERSSEKNNQASTITERDNVYKIAIYIQGFTAEEIKTQFSSSTELIIEAKCEKKEEGSTSTRKFQRCFIFPNSVNVEAVTSSLSSDGILTISAPKKILEESKTNRSCSNYDENDSNLNNGWEDEKTHQSSSERDGVRTKTFSKCKSSYQHITKST